MSNQEIMEYLDPDLAKFMEESESQIPENENIVIFNGSFFANYYLYPRKIYTYPFATSPQGIPEQWLEEKKIKWALSFNSRNSVEDSRDARLFRLV
jgi:hypothetical protein